jgi:hypothetical protein
MPASTAFNPRTAYREEWRYVDGVEDGVLITREANAEEIESHPVKLLRADVTRADFQQLGLGLLITPEAKVWYLWRLFVDGRPEPPEPTNEDTLELAADGDGNPTHWLIQQVAEIRSGTMFVCVCVKGRVNE